MVFFFFLPSRLFLLPCASFNLPLLSPSFPLFLPPISILVCSPRRRVHHSSDKRTKQRLARYEKSAFLSRSKKKNSSHLALDGDPGVAVAVVRRDVLHRQLAVLPRRGRRHGRARLLDGRLLRVGVEEVGDDGVPEREEGRGRR